MNVKKEDIFIIIQKEFEDNPEATSIDISIKHKIPLTIVEMFRRKIEKT
jgi:hypothetical protein